MNRLALASMRIDAGKLGWAAGEFGLACYAAISTTYLLFFATEVLHLPPAWAGLAMLLARLWNIAGDPVVGVLSDRTRSRFGRRRPFLLAGTVLWGAAFCMLFALPRLADRWSATLLFGGLFVINNTGLTLYQVPYSAMLAEITGDYGERTTLVAYKEIVARVAVLGALFGAPLILAAAPDAAVGFRTIGIVFGAVIAISGSVAFFTTAGLPATAASQHAGWTWQMRPLLENRPFAFVTLAFLFVNLGDAVFSGSLVYYVTRVLGRSPALIGALYPVSSITGILCAPLWDLFARRHGKTAACRIALGAQAICCLLPLGIGADRLWLMYPFMCLYGLFNTGARLLPGAMVPDTVELDYQRTGERREGVIFGLFVFVQQTGFAAGGFVLSLLLALAGVGPGSAAAGGTTGITACFTLAACVLYGSAFLASLGYRLDPRELAIRDSTS